MYLHITIGRIPFSAYRSPHLCWTMRKPSGPIRLNFCSSEKITCYQLDSVWFFLTFNFHLQIRYPFLNSFRWNIHMVSLLYFLCDLKSILKIIFQTFSQNNLILLWHTFSFFFSFTWPVLRYFFPKNGVSVFYLINLCKKRLLHKTIKSTELSNTCNTGRRQLWESLKYLWTCHSNL